MLLCVYANEVKNHHHDGGDIIFVVAFEKGSRWFRCATTTGELKKVFKSTEKFQIILDSQKFKNFCCHI